jgi:hypothetical protein
VIEKEVENKQYQNMAWPAEQRFWDDLMYNSSQWGLATYEQDWLNTEYDHVRCTFSTDSYTRGYR